MDISRAAKLKQIIRHMKLADARVLADEILNRKTDTEIEAMLKEFAERLREEE